MNSLQTRGIHIKPVANGYIVESTEVYLDDELKTYTYINCFEIEDYQENDSHAEMQALAKLFTYLTSKLEPELLNMGVEIALDFVEKEDDKDKLQ